MNIVVSPSTIPSFNLSAEEYLFSQKSKDFLYLYVNEPSVIIGSNQAVINEVDLDYCIEKDISVIRRLSGGGAVYHDMGNLNYSFIHDKTGEPLSAKFLNPIIETLHSLDIPAEIGKRKDIWLDGFKISGTASHISRGRELHHGTLLYDTDLDVLQKALSSKQKNTIKKATASVPSPVINIKTFLSESNGKAPDVLGFIEMVIKRLSLIFNVEETFKLQKDDIEKIEEIRKNKYIQRVWNFKM
ncbi:MAG: lipoate--protein ligase [Fermentimonas sp.]|nr:lipoate--protein ligase [Fermentimonas sp.]